MASKADAYNVEHKRSLCGSKNSAFEAEKGSQFYQICRADLSACNAQADLWQTWLLRIPMNPAVNPKDSGHPFCHSGTGVHIILSGRIESRYSVFSVSILLPIPAGKRYVSPCPLWHPPGWGLQTGKKRGTLVLKHRNRCA